MSPKERASVAGRASAASKTRQQKYEQGRRSYLIGAVKAVVERWSDLSDQQRARIIARAAGESVPR